MKKRDLLIFFGFVVAPLGFFAAGVYYGPKVMKWYAKKKSDEKNTEANSDSKQIETETKIK